MGAGFIGFVVMWAVFMFGLFVLPEVRRIACALERIANAAERESGPPPQCDDKGGG